MAAPSVTYTFVDATTIVHSEVNQNFTDIINGITDGSEDLTISALTCNGAVVMNGAVTLGNATGDDITITGRIASDLDPKTAANNTIGDATQTWQALYLDNGVTNGGTIYFDASSTKFIRANAAGTDLLIDAFTTMTVDANIVPQTDINNTLGTSSLNYTGLHLDNGATDGGAVFFNAGTTEFLKSNAAGTTLSSGGFATVALPAVTATTITGTSTCSFDGAVTINDTGNDVDFRIESSGNANMFFVDGGTNSVVVGSATYAPTTQPEFVVTTGSGSGMGTHFGSTIAAFISNDTSDNAAISIIGGTSGESNIYFGDSGDENRGEIKYQHTSDYMAFTTASGERMRIASDGDVYIASTTTPDGSTGGAGFVEGTFSRKVLRLCQTENGGTQRTVQATYSGAGQVGTITCNNTSTVYNTSSDYRLKENQITLPSALTRVANLKPYEYNFKIDPETRYEGFFAHELHEVVPHAVTGTKDAVDENGDIDPQGVDYSRVVPLLTKAIQEQQSIIEDLKARIETLESR